MQSVVSHNGKLTPEYAFSCGTRPLSRIFFQFRLADKKIQLISGLAEYSRNLRNSAGIWLTNDKFGCYSADI